MSKNSPSQLVIDLMSLQSKIQKRVGGPLSAHGIGLSDYFVLNQLYQSQFQKMRRSDLAESVGLSPSGITRLLNPLEKIGLVEKELNPRDARVSLVTLTSVGKKIYEDAKVSFEQTAQTMFEPLNVAQLKTLSDLLKSVV